MLFVANVYMPRTPLQGHWIQLLLLLIFLFLLLLLFLFLLLLLLLDVENDCTRVDRQNRREQICNLVSAVPGVGDTRDDFKPSAEGVGLMDKQRGMTLHSTSFLEAVKDKGVEDATRVISECFRLFQPTHPPPPVNASRTAITSFCSCLDVLPITVFSTFMTHTSSSLDSGRVYEATRGTLLFFECTIRS